MFCILSIEIYFTCSVSQRSDRVKVKRTMWTASIAKASFDSRLTVRIRITTNEYDTKNQTEPVENRMVPPFYRSWILI